ncbi:nicotinate-nucleotide adenylyltransferase [Vagococcus fluvialis]|jgi:nicotinate-nucleotide adenylyltransferase|uniref:nicotinate-nucleotide adenylyltransferase n=1 Tax=Vagococcus fluvialis TaxID=2738 RepID=UPI000A3485D8|nr:nicotinate-nucleotide adenylyltransferase [Vagococcus fluvialis]MDR2277483.1 nicotinate-nucleotide adenylyltransferase [Vagococcus sp.]OTP31875.1 nicotinate (nicotinamide) nucleotide adenylyltransferase [Enterococcus sp. 6C8_DIV0013]MBO0420251.1 nicotinate-nucleotide adenylyltransferase [Vagococcus fluvialis]MBO0429278.1 nicotinate-nucleotide adenylyltransferase [Vagococcus fluvialis]MBO0437038.1 nicotinate-nucleotide adenylyltransferase [Vagococcus fluvialis]
MKQKISVLNQVEEQVLEKPIKRKRVGILGGGFNPVHVGHLIISDQVSAQLGLDEFYLMPSYQSPHVDKKTTIDSSHRVEMLKLATEDNPKLSLELSEVVRQGKSYTYDTMKTLKEMNPETDYYFVIGGDMVEYLPKWYKIDELMEMVQFVGVNRPGSKQESPYPLIWVDVPLMEISSSTIREKIKMNCSVKYFLPDNVLEYIHKKGLYLNDTDNDL